ncbi:MAG TPA: hypothetical protein VKS79_06980 [Gemmataceae bacterium]|nr:hypothetical protein [Gemmataceae bacterium]
MAQTGSPIQLGFLTVLHEANGYLGGYLVTNSWGRPLEFRVSSAVQPNRVQQILYGASLPAYLYGELIGKTLVEKTATQASLIFTDRQAVLELRNQFEIPILWLAAGEVAAEQDGIVVKPATNARPALVTFSRLSDDVPKIEAVLEQLGDHFDLLEPFSRVREAMTEARKMGVNSRG